MADADADREPPEPLPLAPADTERPPPPELPTPELSAIAPVEAAAADKPVRSDMPPELSALSAETTEAPPLFDTADAPLRNVAITPLSSRPS
jgi:hypothetical protein